MALASSLSPHWMTVHDRAMAPPCKGSSIQPITCSRERKIGHLTMQCWTVNHVLSNGWTVNYQSWLRPTPRTWGPDGLSHMRAAKWAAKYVESKRMCQMGPAKWAQAKWCEQRDACRANVPAKQVQPNGPANVARPNRWADQMGLAKTGPGQMGPTKWAQANWPLGMEVHVFAWPSLPRTYPPSSRT